MKRGDFITIVQAGDFDKPRPALIIQADFFNEEHPTVSVLLVSSTLVNAPLLRITIQPNKLNGLERISQIQVDKVMTVRREKLGPIFGSAGSEVMLSVTRALAVFLGIA